MATNTLKHQYTSFDKLSVKDQEKWTATARKFDQLSGREGCPSPRPIFTREDWNTMCNAWKDGARFLDNDLWLDECIKRLNESGDDDLFWK